MATCSPPRCHGLGDEEDDGCRERPCDRIGILPHDRGFFRSPLVWDAGETRFERRNIPGHLIHLLRRESGQVQFAAFLIWPELLGDRSFQLAENRIKVCNVVAHAVGQGLVQAVEPLL